MNELNERHQASLRSVTVRSVATLEIESPALERVVRIHVYHPFGRYGSQRALPVIYAQDGQHPSRSESVRADGRRAARSTGGPRSAVEP